MGSDFSPAVWEVPRRLTEKVAEKLFDDKSLIIKHRARLDKLTWGRKLGKIPSKELVPAHKTETHQGVLMESGEPANTPHHMFVDDDIYTEVFCKARVEQAIASSIEAVFIILGQSDTKLRQDPVSWDKLEEMTINYSNIILGVVVDTRRMRVGPKREFLQKVIKLLKGPWNEHRQSFTLKEAETLAGQLNHIANTALWLKHLMSHIYTSIAAALKTNKAYLIGTNKHFRDQLKLAKATAYTRKEHMEQTFAQAETSRKIHNNRKIHFLVPTLRAELKLIREALELEWLDKSTPIAHLIPGIIDATMYGDSSLDSAGGWSTDMELWWWIDWSQRVRVRTLRHVKDGSDGTLIDINCLEYATILINYAAAYCFWVTMSNLKRRGIPYPRVLIYADNQSSEYWAIKGCKRSFTGRRLGRLQCAMMMGNPVGLDTGHVTTKFNVIADRISRWKQDTDLLLNFDVLQKEFPQLHNCRRFLPSPQLISLVEDVLLSDKLPSPTKVNQTLRNFPGRIVS